MGSSVSGVGVLDKAVTLLEVLETGPLGLSAAVEASGVTRATAYRLLSALEVHGLVSRSGGTYALGPGLARLGTAALAGPSLADAARSALEELRDRTGESTQLYLPRGDIRVCVASLESPHSLRTIVPVGAHLPMDRGSAGTVLRDQDGVRRRGWAQSIEEREPGVASVSAPVRAPAGRSGTGPVMAAVSVSGPVERTSRAPGKRYAESVMKAASAIERAWFGTLSPPP